MKRRTRVVLLGLTGVVVVGVFFWMRELVSWRPQQVAILPTGSQFCFESGAEPVIVTSIFNGNGNRHSQSLNLSNGHVHLFSKETNLLLGVVDNTGAGEAYFWFCFQKADEVELYDIQTGELKHRFVARSELNEPFEAIRLTRKARSLCAWRNAYFWEWDVASEKLIRKVKLQSPWPPNSNREPLYAISPGGKWLISYLNTTGRMWDARNGHLLKQWSLQLASSSLLPEVYRFSPDARFILFRPFAIMNGPSSWQILDASTGCFRWGFRGEFEPDFAAQGDECVVPQTQNCEVRDVATGRILRQLPGPRQRDGEIISFNSDFIYTMNSRKIFRWRAR